MEGAEPLKEGYEGILDAYAAAQKENSTTDIPESGANTGNVSELTKLQTGLTVISDGLGFASDAYLNSSLSPMDQMHMNSNLLGITGKFVNSMNMALSLRKVVDPESSIQDKTEGSIEITLGALDFTPYPLAWLPGAVYTVAAYDKDATKELNKKMQSAFTYNVTNFDQSSYGQNASIGYPVVNGQKMVPNIGLLFYNIKKSYYEQMGWDFSDPVPPAYVPAVP